MIFELEARASRLKDAAIGTTARLIDLLHTAESNHARTMQELATVQDEIYAMKAGLSDVKSELCEVKNYLNEVHLEIADQGTLFRSFRDTQQEILNRLPSKN